MPRATPTVLELDVAAAGFLDLLVELGHLDERMLQLVNDRLLDLPPAADPAPRDQAAQGRVVRLQDLKRVAAQVIAENLSDTDPDYQRAVAREWPVLFH